MASNSASATGTGTAGEYGSPAFKGIRADARCELGTGAKSSGSTATGSAATTSTSKAAAANMVPLLGSVWRVG